MEPIDLALNVMAVHTIGHGNKVLIKGSADTFRITEQRAGVGLVIQRIATYNEVTGRYTYHDGKYRLLTENGVFTGEAVPVGTRWGRIAGGSFILTAN